MQPKAWPIVALAFGVFGLVVWTIAAKLLQAAQLHQWN